MTLFLGAVPENGLYELSRYAPLLLLVLALDPGIWDAATGQLIASWRCLQACATRYLGSSEGLTWPAS